MKKIITCNKCKSKNVYNLPRYQEPEPAIYDMTGYIRSLSELKSVPAVCSYTHGILFCVDCKHYVEYHY